MARGYKFSEEQIQDIIIRYQNGESTDQINDSTYHFATVKPIKRILKQHGIELRGPRKYHYDEHIFDIIDTAEKAYWIGFITADGYINEERQWLSIKLQGSDINHLYKFADFVGCSRDAVKIEYHNITKKPLCCISLYSSYIVNALVQKGLRQNKSDKEHVVEVPYDFIKDYIRGIIDGDGCIQQTKIDITNSEEVLNFIREYLSEICDINIGKIINTDNRHRIYICKNRETVLMHLYYDNCVCLDRKYDYILKHYKVIAVSKSGKIGED